MCIINYCVIRYVNIYNKAYIGWRVHTEYITNISSLIQNIYCENTEESNKIQYGECFILSINTLKLYSFDFSLFLLWCKNNAIDAGNGFGGAC